MKNKVKKEKYFLLISVYLILCLYLLMLCGCKAKYSVEVLKESEPGIQASLEIPIYEGYEEFSDYVRTQLLNDYKKYKQYAIDEWNLYHLDTLTYRTVFNDLSNSKYINVYIEKYIPAGSTMEDEYIITFCYDKKNRKLVDITQIAGMSIEELSSYCKKYLKKNISDIDEKSREYINEDIDNKMIPKKVRYSCFSVQNKKLTIYFAPDEIVPKYYGVQKVELFLK